MLWKHIDFVRPRPGTRVRIYSSYGGVTNYRVTAVIPNPSFPWDLNVNVVSEAHSSLTSTWRWRRSAWLSSDIKRVEATLPYCPKEAP